MEHPGTGLIGIQESSGISLWFQTKSAALRVHGVKFTEGDPGLSQGWVKPRTIGLGG